MQLTDLDFTYPENLVATERLPQSRIMLVGPRNEPRELPDLASLFQEFRAGDCLVINNTRVLRRRVFSQSGLEILFLSTLESSGDSTTDSTTNSGGESKELAGRRWQVLCPSSRWKAGTKQILPGGVSLELVSRGRPQVVEASEALPESYFEEHGEMPLPPYIQKARGDRHNRNDDKLRYQTAWAEEDGSLAAPTASLHFSTADLDSLRAQGVKVVEVTLHVGLGTFLPVTVENLDDHVMHAEVASIPAKVWEEIQATRARGRRVWALGTTVTRTLESAAHGLLVPDGAGGFRGATDLFIRPGFEFKVIGGLLTNFHQPRSTLLALVAAFADLETVKKSYAWAIERGFRLFSYGDLSVWIK